MRLGKTAILSLSCLLLAACGASNTPSEPAAKALPASLVGGLNTSNDYWNKHRPYTWDETTPSPSNGGSASSTTGGSIVVTPDGTIIDQRSWLEQVGMNPQWGPDGHTLVSSSSSAATVAQVTSSSSSSRGSFFGTSATKSSSSAGGLFFGTSSNSSSSKGSSSFLSSQSSSASTANGPVRLPSGTTLDGQVASNGQTAGGGSNTITLPSGRVITVNGTATSSSSSSSATGSGTKLATRTGTRGCPAPGPNVSTFGSGWLLPGLINGNCPLNTTMLKVAERPSVFGSMDF